MIGTLSKRPIRTLREVAPKCTLAAARRALLDRTGRTRLCLPTCYERAVVCNFKSTFDPYTPPMAPWRAGAH